MQLFTVLSVIGVVQIIFCALLVFVLMVHRRRTTRAEQLRARFAQQLVEPLRTWALGERSMESLLPLLRAVPPTIALESIAVHCAVRATPTERTRMATLLRVEPWVQQLLDMHRSRQWVDRLRAARMLVVAGAPTDRPILTALLSDPHAAVVSAALSAVRPLGDAVLVETLLTSLPTRPEYLRARSVDALRDAGSLTLAPLQARLRSECDPVRLRLYLEVADHLADPRTIVHCAAHATHADVGVRRAVARACQHYFSERAHPVLTALLQDESPEVRAEAARSLGEIRATACVPALASALRDGSHAVRVAAALALAHIGVAGRTALVSAEQSDDRFAADAACFVNGLSRGAIRELAEV